MLFCCTGLTGQDACSSSRLCCTVKQSILRDAHLCGHVCMYVEEAEYTENCHSQDWGTIQTVASVESRGRNFEGAFLLSE